MNEISFPSWHGSLVNYPRQSTVTPVDGHSMHSIDTGRENEGRPAMLMVHGNPTWSFYYRSVINHFGTAFRSVAVDHIGCGLSDKPREYNYCLDQHIENLCTLITQKDLQDITLVVHDWGGPIGLGAAMKMPERFSRFVILNTAGFPPPYFPWRIRVCRLPVFGSWAVRGLNLFARAAIKMATTQPGGLPADVKAGLLAPYDSWSNRIAVQKFVDDIPVRASEATWKTLEGIRSGLSSLNDKPVQFIWGMQDWCFRPECLDLFLEEIPSARVEKIETAGHYVVEDATQTVLHTIDSFVKDTN